MFPLQFYLLLCPLLPNLQRDLISIHLNPWCKSYPPRHTQIHRHLCTLHRRWRCQIPSWRLINQLRQPVVPLQFQRRTTPKLEACQPPLSKNIVQIPKIMQAPNSSISWAPCPESVIDPLCHPPLYPEPSQPNTRYYIPFLLSNLSFFLCILQIPTVNHLVYYHLPIFLLIKARVSFFCIFFFRLAWQGKKKDCLAS